jgi:hypothetical protein
MSARKKIEGLAHAARCLTAGGAAQAALPLAREAMVAAVHADGYELIAAAVMAAAGTDPGYRVQREEVEYYLDMIKKVRE